MTPPTCQGSGILHPEREMKLVHETEAFWSFACECGCIKAFSKPSVKANATYQREQQAVERLRQQQNRARTAYSFATRN